VAEASARSEVPFFGEEVKRRLAEGFNLKEVKPSKYLEYIDYYASTANLAALLLH
jgi:hypothetical protein